MSQALVTSLLGYELKRKMFVPSESGEENRQDAETPQKTNSIKKEFLKIRKFHALERPIAFIEPWSTKKNSKNCYSKFIENLNSVNHKLLSVS